MAIIAPTPITALPAAPDPNNRTTFDALAYPWAAAQGVLATEANALASNVYNNATESAASATTATTKADEAAASANAAAQVAAVWVSGANYAVGNLVFSPTDFLTYRRKTAGGGTTDPNLDSVNWQSMSAGIPQWQIKTANFTAVSNDALQCDTTASAFTITLPATPTANVLVHLADYAGKFATNNLTVARNGSNIMGLAEDMVISTNNVSITLQFVDATQGWRIV